MKPSTIYDKYPLWIVAIVNILMLAVYVAGAYITFKLSLITGILYTIYIFLLEYYNIKEGCTCCCYYGKECAFGKGIIASKLFRKEDPNKFSERELSFKDLIPQILVFLIPLIIGTALLVARGFDLLILVTTIYPIFSYFCLNQIIYGKLACPHCKQGNIYCPALKFFTKNK
ncbi:MAG: hypothetical protein K8R74_05915 [Bacteroidales bacterium]|nr:hypothetical protein [Bacteroidales bacterium]